MRQLLKITSIFALALVFTAGMAFGQNTGAIQNSDVPGAFNSKENVSIIQQAEYNPSPEAVATVEQAGENNASLLRQDIDASTAFPGTPQSPEAIIQMTGNDNYSNIFQQVGGSGHSDVTVKMEGNNNILSNDGTRQGARSNDSDVRVQGGSEYDVSILGNNNQVASETIVYSDVDVTVEGNGNDIAARSEGYTPGLPRNRSSINVLGDMNDISVSQGVDQEGQWSDPSGGHFSSVAVEGSGNSVTVEQAASTTVSYGLNQGSLISTPFLTP